MRLLLVEDHPWVSRRLATVLGGRGATIVTVSCLGEAKESLLHQDPFNAVVCEQQVSDGTALELLAWMRWQQHVPAPFLLIARNEEFDVAHDAAFGVVSMPFVTHELLARLNALIRLQAGGVIARQIPFAGEPHAFS
jgi:DNA-binding response OmpR family regulator